MQLNPTPRSSYSLYGQRKEMAVDLGRSFQPRPSTIPATCALVGKANLTFIDEILRRVEDGSLPPRS